MLYLYYIRFSQTYQKNVSFICFLIIDRLSTYNFNEQIQMLSFGQLKNNLQALKKMLGKMQIYESFHLNPTDITQQSLRSKNPELFLQLLNFTMIQYSKQLYSQIIEIDPLVKATNDQKFVQSIFSISRKILNFNPNLTVDQFLSSKFFQAKVELLAKLTKSVLSWESSKKKVIGKIQKKERIPQIKTNPKQSYLQNDDSQDQMPKKIVIQPTPMSIDVGPIKQKQHQQEKRKTSKFNYGFEQTKAPNIFPKSYTNQQTQIGIANKREVKMPDRFQNNHRYQQQQSDEQSNDMKKDYVSREEFNQALELLSTVNTTVNNMVDKFNNFQNSVVGWVNNINAKISIMQENIKMIKANL